MSLACGSLAGLVSSTATFPLDLVRRRMQLQGQGGSRVVYSSFGQALRSIVATEGVRGLYAGILPEYAKVCVCVWWRRVVHWKGCGGWDAGAGKHGG